MNDADYIELLWRCVYLGGMVMPSDVEQTEALLEWSQLQEAATVERQRRAEMQLGCCSDCGDPIPGLVLAAAKARGASTITCGKCRMAELGVNNTMVDIDDKRLKFVSFMEASTPPAGLIDHIKDAYWITHPDKGVVYRIGFKGSESPQCNTNPEIVERVKDFYPWAEIKFIPSVFRRINLSEYRD